MIAVGGTFLLQSLPLLAPHVGSLLFVALGLAFVVPYAQDRRRYIYLVPGAVLIGIGLGLFLPGLLGQTAAGIALFYISMTVAFAAMYLLEPTKRWPLVPAAVFGVLSVLSSFGAVTFIPGLVQPLITPLLLVGVGVYLLLHD